MIEGNRTSRQPAKLKVVASYHNRSAGSVRVPMIRMRGLWLQDAGFRQSYSVKVEVGHGEIRLTLIPTPPPTPGAGGDC